MKPFVWLMKLVVFVGIGVCCTWAGAAAAQKTPSAGPFATKAKVEVKTEDEAVVPLKREEQIAFMFVNAINSLEDDCSRHAAEPCTLDALIRGPKAKEADWPVGKLKFDPNAADPNYTYKIELGTGDRKWQVWAEPRKAGFGGFYVRHGFKGGTWYNPAGPATEKDRKLTETSIEGDLFLVK